MNAVSNRFVRQIKKGLIQIGYPERAIEENYDFIGQTGIQHANLVAFGDLTFRSLTNEMLSYFYEHAFVTPKIRKQLGIYYTPPELAHNMLSRLPIEDIPPEKRFVFDGSCGSGSLLGMAYERLESLLPVHQNSDEKYRYLTEHIWGLDKDGFASEIAQLSLLLKKSPLFLTVQSPMLGWRV